jgi:hypothetical protein
MYLTHNVLKPNLESCLISRIGPQLLLWNASRPMSRRRRRHLYRTSSHLLYEYLEGNLAEHDTYSYEKAHLELLLAFNDS